MAKRGWRASHRVRYRWANGLAGTVTCYGPGQVETEMARFRQHATDRQMPLAVAVDTRVEVGEGWILGDETTIHPEEG